MTSGLVSSVWLRKQLINGLKNIRIVDASWAMDTGSDGGKTHFNQERIESAVFFDVDEISDKSSVYDHMLPSAQVFQEHVGKMGISNYNHVVVYDSNSKYGLFSSPRVWWMFRAFGHESVSVLDGGLEYWKQLRYPMEARPPHAPVPQRYTASYNPQLVRTLEQVQNLLGSDTEVVDARSEGRFSGSDPEPRPSLSSGHMIGAKNVPFMKLIDSDTKLLKKKEDLRKVFEGAGVDISKPMVSTCGSGITACIIGFAAHLLTQQNVPVYDGSWVEWVQAAPPSSWTKDDQ